eukprot:gene611-335_t
MFPFNKRKELDSSQFSFRKRKNKKKSHNSYIQDELFNPSCTRPSAHRHHLLCISEGENKFNIYKKKNNNYYNNNKSVAERKRSDRPWRGQNTFEPGKTLIHSVAVVVIISSSRDYLTSFGAHNIINYSDTHFIYYYYYYLLRGKKKKKKKNEEKKQVLLLPPELQFIQPSFSSFFSPSGHPLTTVTQTKQNRARGEQLKRKKTGVVLEDPVLLDPTVVQLLLFLAFLTRLYTLTQHIPESVGWCLSSSSCIVSSFEFCSWTFTDRSRAPPRCEASGPAHPLVVVTGLRSLVGPFSSVVVYVLCDCEERNLPLTEQYIYI